MGGGSIDELAETMVNFATNRLIPGLPSYVHRISIPPIFFYLFFLYFFSLFPFLSLFRIDGHSFRHVVEIRIIKTISNILLII